MTHFPVHTLITSNKAAFIATVVIVGLTGSAFVRFTFSYLDRMSREAFGLTESASSRDAAPVALGEPTTVNIGRLKWVAILAPAGLFITWEYVAHFVVHSAIASEAILFLVTVAAVGLGATAFTHAFFRLLERLQQQLVRQNRELASRSTALEALYEIGTGLSALLDVRTVKGTAVRKARQLFGADTAGLALLHESQAEVQWDLLAGATSDEFRTLKLQLGQCVAGQVIQSGEPVIIEDVAQEVEGLATTHPLLVVENLRAALVVPVRIAGKPVGALMVGHRTPYSFHLSDLKLLMSLANQVAVAINNAQLYERLGALSALEERERLAREMHDGLAQLLGHVAARATATSELLAQGKIEGVQEQLSRLREVAQDAYVDVRQSILGLRTRPSAKRGLLEGLGEYVQRITEQEGLPVHLETVEGADTLELAPAVEVQAIRIIQEALSNVRKHAQAQEAWVKVGGDTHWVTITIQDNGQGFDPTRMNGRGGHFGLETMRERAEAVGGRLTIETAPGKGTSVTVQLPVSREE
ncbi:MAG: GAF domain-containing protein [Dehalococcoidia bacterium]